MKKLLFALVTLALSTTATFAASYTWNGGSGDWSVAGNWTPGSGPPGASDDATVNSGTVTVSSGTIVSNLNFAGGTLQSGATLTISNLLNWTAGDISGSGRTVIAPGAAANLGGPTYLEVRGSGLTLENGGTMILSGAGGLHMSTSSILTNRAGATFETHSDATITATGGTGAGGRIDNAGTFRRHSSAGSGTNIVNINFNNYGVVDLQSGTLQWGDMLNNFNSATVLLAAGTTNRLGGSGASTGTFTNPPSSLVDFTSTYTLNPGARLDGAGLYRLNGSGLNLNTDVAVFNLNFAGGTLQSGATLTISNLLNWTAGDISGSGRTVIAPGAAANLGGPTYLEVRGSGLTLENGGTMILSGAGGLHMSTSSILTNRAGATFETHSDATITATGGTGAGGRIDNAGTFRRHSSAGSGTNIVNINFNNYGVVDLQSGTLQWGDMLNNFNSATVLLAAGTTNRLGGSGASTGTFTNPPSSLVDFTSTYTLNPGARLDGAGLYRLNGSGLNLNTDVAVFNLNFAGGTLQSGATLTISNLLNWTAGDISGSGRTVIAPGAAANLGGPTYLEVRGSGLTLENGGTMILSGAGGLHMSTSSILTNRAGATFETHSDATITATGGTGAGGRIDNAGTFRRHSSAGSGTNIVNINFNNYGTVDVQSGAVNFIGGYTQTGGILSFGIGSLTDFGRINIAGNAPLTGTLNVNLRNGYQPGLSDTFQVMTYSSHTGTFSAVTGCSIGNGFFFEPIYESTQVLLGVKDGTPQLDSAELSMIDGLFHFRLTTGFDGQTFIIQASTTLTNWIPISTNTLPNCVLDFVDPNSMNFPRRFYRALLVP